MNGLIPASVGSRWEDGDARQGERVVRVVKTRRVLGVRLVRYVIELAARNPRTEGRKRWLRESTLRRYYYRISR